MKSIKNIVKTLVNEEKEQLKDLISECKKREEDLDYIKSVLNSNIAKIEKIEKIVQKDFTKIIEYSSQIEALTENPKDKMYQQLLKSLPDDRFFYA
jgi:phage-related protein